MTGLDAVTAVASATPRVPPEVGAPGLNFASLSAAPCQTASIEPSESFAELITRGAGEVEARVDRADQLVRSFVVDGSIPVHEVTIALEEARIAVELALQVRTRLVEAYRDIMNMQL